MNGPEIIPTIVSITIVMLALAATLAALRWATKNRGVTKQKGRRKKSSVEISERHSVGRNASVIVVRYAGREHLLGITESQITPISEGTIDLRDTAAQENERAEKNASGEDQDTKTVNRALDALRDRTVRR